MHIKKLEYPIDNDFQIIEKYSLFTYKGIFIDSNSNRLNRHEKSQKNKIEIEINKRNKLNNNIAR